MLKKTSTFANLKPTEQWFMLNTGSSLKYMHGVCKNITHEHKIHLHTPKLGFWSIKHHEILPTISPSMCPHFCGHVHKVWTLPKHKLHLQNCSHAYMSNTHIGYFLWYAISHNCKKITNWTHKLLQNCPYEYDPPVYKDVSPVHLHDIC